MQERPDSSTLLDGVARFLLEEVAPAVGDKALAFRVMIAANLAAVVAGDLRTRGSRQAAELARLNALLPGAVGDLAAHNRELVARLRRQELDAEALASLRQHAKKTALEALAVVNPRFDTSEEIE